MTRDETIALAWRVIYADRQQRTAACLALIQRALEHYRCELHIGTGEYGAAIEVRPLDPPPEQDDAQR